MHATGQDAFLSWFGDDLEALLRQIEGEVESAEELTRLVSPRQRKASFKLRLRDGRLFKARRLKSPKRWTAAVTLAPLPANLACPHSCLPR